MALSIAAIGNAVTATSANSWAATATANVAIGNAVVITLLEGSASNPLTSVVDSVGNTYVRLAACLDTAGTSSGTTARDAEIWWCASITNAIVNASTTFTATIAGAASSATKSMQVYGITGAVGSVACRDFSHSCSVENTAAKGLLNALNADVMVAIGRTNGAVTTNPTDDASWTTDISGQSGIAGSKRPYVHSHRTAGADGVFTYGPTIPPATAVGGRTDVVMAGFYDTNNVNTTGLITSLIKLEWFDAASSTDQSIIVGEDLPIGTVLALVAVNGATNTTVTISDPHSNTWTAQLNAHANAGASAGNVHIYTTTLTTALVAGDTITVTISGASASKSTALWKISGAGSIAVRDAQSASNTSTTDNVSVTTVSGDQVLGASLPSTSSAATQDVTWDDAMHIAVGAAGNTRDQTHARKKASGSSTTYTLTWAGSITNLVAAISFKIASVTNNKAVTIASTTSTSFVRSSSKNVVASLASTTTIIKSTAKKITASLASTTTVIKSTAKNITASLASTVTRLSAIIRAQSVVASSVSTTTVRRTPAKIVVITSTSTVSLLRALTKLVSITSTSTTTVIKSAAKLVSITSTSTTTVLKSTAKKITASLATTLLALVGLLRQQAVTAALTSTTTVRRTPGKIVTAALTSTVTMQRATSKRIIIAATSTTTVLKSTAKRIIIAATSTTVFLRSVAKRVIASSTIATTVLRNLGKTISTSLTTTVTRTMVRVLAISVALATNMTITKRVTFAVPVAAITTVTVPFSATVVFVGGAARLVISAALSAAAYFGSFWKDDTDPAQTWTDTVDESLWVNEVIDKPEWGNSDG